MKSHQTLCSAVSLVGLLAAGAVPADAADVTGFYKGKVINYIVATAPGGGYDTYARLIAKHMTKYLPAGTKVVIRNIPGAGHIIGANQVYSAKPDGLTIGTFNTGLIYAQLLKTRGVKFDLSKYTWIGKAATDPRVVVVGGSSGIETIDDLKRPGEPIKFAASGVGSAAYNEIKMLVDSLGWNVRIIPGYNGREDELAIMRGEVTGSVGSLSSYEDFVKINNGRLLMQIGGKPAAGVPSAAKVVTSGRGKAVVALIGSQGELGRLTAAPPGVPADRAAFLRKAYMMTLEDKTLQAEAKKLGRPIEPLYGEDVAKAVKEALNQDAESIALLGSLVNAKPKGIKVASVTLVTSDGKNITFKNPKGDMVKSAVSGSRSKVSIGGKSAKRNNLKAGMVCDIEYTPSDRNEPTAVACK